MQVFRVLIFAVAALTACASPLAAQDTGFLNRVVAIDGVDYKYQVYVPSGIQRSASLPIILALHGGGQYGRDGLLQTGGGLATAIRRHAERFPAIVVFPQSPPDGTPGFQGLGERLALAALDKSAAEFKADAARTYLTGLSMGGNGAWYLVYHHPERFAAVLVVCGFVREFTGKTSGVHYPAIADGTGAVPFATIAKRIARVPIWVFHGDADTSVSVEESRLMTAALKAAGGSVHYTELPGVEHNAWDPAYDRADVISWLLAQKR